MRIATILFTALIVADISRADLVIREKVVSAEQNGIITTKIKGDKTRKDMPTELLGDVTVITDLKTGDKIMMIHEKKLARMQSAQNASSDAAAVTPKAVDTGKSETVGGYDAEIYTWTNNSDSGGTLWVAKNYPGYAKIRQVIAHVNASLANQKGGHKSPDTGALPGMVVKSKVKSPVGEFTFTLISATETPVSDSDFRIPPDYRVSGLTVSPGH